MSDVQRTSHLTCASQYYSILLTTFTYLYIIVKVFYLSVIFRVVAAGNEKHDIFYSTKFEDLILTNGCMSFDIHDTSLQCFNVHSFHVVSPAAVFRAITQRSLPRECCVTTLKTTFLPFSLSLLSPLPPPHRRALILRLLSMWNRRVLRN